eukprot:Polyplicarium_translucidae@DN2261_c0_g1_i3.p1
MKKLFRLFRRGKSSKAAAKVESPVSSSEASDVVARDAPAVEVPSGQVLNRKRLSVSAEAYGEHNKMEDFDPPVYEKTEEQKERIRATIADSFLFNTLEPEATETVVDAFQERRVAAKETIINQGDDGDCLFLIESGEFEALKKKHGESAMKVAHMATGDTFGELALLYNAPRAASVVSISEATVWALDRLTFNHIVKGAAARKRDLYDGFLSEVDILKDMDPYERSKLGDALKKVRFTEATTIIKQGEAGDTFFIVEKGDAFAVKNGVEVMQYGRGDYFGELALIRDQPRAASVVARTDVECIVLDRKSFKRLLGPVENILRRNTRRYSQVQQRLALNE